MQANTWIGRMVDDISDLKSAGKHSYGQFRFAVNNGKNHTDFFYVTAFDKTAELIKKYAPKGRLLAINVYVHNNNWTDKQGNKHYSYEFIARSIELEGSSKTNSDKPADTKSKKTDLADAVDKVQKNTQKDAKAKADEVFAQDGPITLSDQDLPF